MTPPENIQPVFPYSATSSQSGKLSKYSILAHVYFFFNSVLLPRGLLFTTILSPIFFYNLLLKKRRTYWLEFTLFLIFFDCIHLMQSVDLNSFLVSNVLFTLIYFTVISFYYFFNNYPHLGKIFRQLLLFNTVLTIIAIPFFFLQRPYREYFWYINKLTTGFSDFPRLALFTYEASYYAMLMVPVFYYYLLKFIFNKIEHNKWLTIMLASLPMLLSLSFGVLGVTALTALIMGLIFCRRLFKFKKPFIIIVTTIFLFLVSGIVLFILFPDNALFIRLENIFTGKDTSANGRVVDSFGMAWRIILSKNVFFGIGLGQIKFMAIEVAHNYYKYWGMLPRYDIPNAMSETLAIFGVVGAVFRLFLEGWLFFKTKVYTNYYRLALFIFVFIYQFTGSFITNIVEYVLWALAFSTVFQQFNISDRNAKDRV